MAEWSGDHWRAVGPATLGLDPSDLDRINADALEEMLPDFGTYSFSKSQAQSLVRAAKKAWKENGKDCFPIFRRVGAVAIFWLYSSCPLPLK